jgi:hypothetical protein
MEGKSSEALGEAQHLYQNVLIYGESGVHSSRIPGVWLMVSGFSLPVVAVWAKMPSFHLTVDRADPIFPLSCQITGVVHAQSS